VPQLETRNLCKHFRGGSRGEVRAVDDISLTIESGQCVLLTGACGPSKTTLLAMLGALVDRRVGG
jgi:putative ABC transport system ATP-binding protein